MACSIVGNAETAQMVARRAQPIKGRNPADDLVRGVFANKIHYIRQTNEAMNPTSKDATIAVTPYPVASHLARRPVQLHVESDKHVDAVISKSNHWQDDETIEDMMFFPMDPLDV